MAGVDVMDFSDVKVELERLNMAVKELALEYVVLKKRLSWLENKNAEPGMVELLKDKQDADAEVRKVKEESTKQG